MKMMAFRCILVSLVPLVPTLVRNWSIMTHTSIFAVLLSLEDLKQKSLTLSYRPFLQQKQKTLPMKTSWLSRITL